MHFSILFDHALKHCENSFFVMVLKCLVTLVLISSTPWKRVPLRIPFSFGKRKKMQGASLAIRWMMQSGDFFRDQELFHAEGCVGRNIVVMQHPSFFCSGSSLFLTNFVDKTSQNFLVKVLVNCLPLMNKLMMHHSLMVKEGDQHHFHLSTLHAGFLWSGRGHTFPLLTLSFCFRIILKDP